MPVRYVRLTLDDVAKHAKPMEDIEMSPAELAQFNAAHQSEFGGDELSVVKVEGVTRACDVDIENSRRWQTNIQLTCVVSFDPDRFDKSIFTGVYRPWPNSARPLMALCSNAVDMLGEPGMNFSGKWVVAESADLVDYMPSPAGNPQQR